MKSKRLHFIDTNGSFICADECALRALYFPLCNQAPFMSSVTPTLQGDIKTTNNTFLLEPASRISLTNSKASRNFWVHINPSKTWSAAGVSKDRALERHDQCSLEAGLLYQRVTRQNKKIGLAAQITSFVPSSGEALEIMQVALTNISNRPITYTPWAAIPIYGRSANNIRDHRHVTSLLNRIQCNRYGVTVTPTLLFDESGHHKNTTSYSVWGFGPGASGPHYIFPTQEGFCGQAGDLEAPQAVLENARPDNTHIQGKEAMAGLRFKKTTLAPGASHTYIVILQIGHGAKKALAQACAFNTPEKVWRALLRTKQHWQALSNKISLTSRDPVFDQWFRWVSVQPLLRKIFGCSFLPDHDYGRGGRGWRDLWQDCLSLLLTNPHEVRQLLINNFRGVRIDGSNATIIGTKPGEFMADRNNISRVWMDHGVWPVMTTLLYIHQTGDIQILLERATYFCDRQLSRGSAIDYSWTPQKGSMLKTKKGSAYQGSLLEHMLVQNLVQFFNVGRHNLIRLEGADWNDGLDMAAEHGESVAFSTMYAKNLLTLAEAIKRLPQKKINLAKELALLLDTCFKPVPYSRARAKQTRLAHYFEAVKTGVTGTIISIDKDALMADLAHKAHWLSAHIRKNEWLKEGFFNGYYDNTGARTEGTVRGRLRMSLTGQVFPIMSGVATQEQIGKIFKNATRLLKDKTLGGFRLNTDFGQEQHALGRAFSFVYGEKENGAFFSHMAVMFAYALYAQGHAAEGWEVIESIYRMSCDTATSLIYPGLPEYFNSEGRGMYHYLTGSASWLVFTLLTQACGIRGNYGDLIIEPKLTQAQFSPRGFFSIATVFAGKQLEVYFKNPRHKEYGAYAINKVTCNGRTIDQGLDRHIFCISRTQLCRIANKRHNRIEITLG